MGLLEIAEALLKEKFGEENVRAIRKEVKGGRAEFPVLRANGEIISSLKISKMLQTLPSEVLEYLLVEPKIRDAARDWFAEKLKTLIQKSP